MDFRDRAPPLVSYLFIVFYIIINWNVQVKLSDLQHADRDSEIELSDTSVALGGDKTDA